MSADVKTRISENLEYLKRNTVRLKLLISELVSADLLTFEQADVIMEQPNHLTMHETMYKFLMNDLSSSNGSGGATNDLRKLLKALRSSGNGHLVEVISTVNTSQQQPSK